MLHPRGAALLRASIASLMILEAASASARAAFAFELVPPPAPVHHPHRAAWVCALAGAGLIGASFPLTSAADRRYGEYLREADPAAIPGRWDATTRADRIASGSLLTGEALMVTGAWLGFVHRTRGHEVAITLQASRCALSCRF